MLHNKQRKSHFLAKCPTKGGKKKKKGKHRRSEVLAEGSFYSWKRSESSGNADSHLHKWGFRVPEVTRKEQEEGL